MNDIIKRTKSLAESGFLIKAVSQKSKKEGKEQKGGFLSMLLGTLDATLLGNLLVFKRKMITGKGTIRSGKDF